MTQETEQFLEQLCAKAKLPEIFDRVKFAIKVLEDGKGKIAPRGVEGGLRRLAALAKATASEMTSLEAVIQSLPQKE